MDKYHIIYDSDCSVCRGAMEWIKKRDINDLFEFVPMNTPHLEEKFPMVNREDCEKAVHLITPEGMVYTGEAAIREVLRHIKGYSVLSRILDMPLLNKFSGLFYSWFSKRRYKIAEVFLARKEKR